MVTSGDGIARVEGLPSAMANELLEFENGTLGIALNLDVREIGVVVLGDSEGIEEGSDGQAHRRGAERPGRRRLPRPRGGRHGQPDRRSRRAHRRPRAARPGTAGRRRHGPAERQRAAADRHQGHRRDDPDRTRPAAADHRRPQDRQDRDRRRHDHQPEGGLGHRRPDASRCAASTSPSARRAPRSRRCAPSLEEAGALEYTTIVHSPASDPAGLQVHRPLHRLGHRPALDVRRQARADRLRRPDQAGRGLPFDVAAAAPPAGPRGLPGRRVLPAQPPAGALREAVRRTGRRFDDRPADHRDQGQRRVGLHSRPT